MLNVYYPNAMVLAVLAVEGPPPISLFSSRVSVRRRSLPGNFRNSSRPLKLLLRHLLFARRCPRLRACPLSSRTILFTESAFRIRFTFPLRDWLWFLAPPSSMCSSSPPIHGPPCLDGPFSFSLSSDSSCSGAAKPLVGASAARRLPSLFLSFSSPVTPQLGRHSSFPYGNRFFFFSFFFFSTPRFFIPRALPFFFSIAGRSTLPLPAPRPPLANACVLLAVLTLWKRRSHFPNGVPISFPGRAAPSLFFRNGPQPIFSSSPTSSSADLQSATSSSAKPFMQQIEDRDIQAARKKNPPLP